MKVWVYQQCGGPCNDSYVKVFAEKNEAQAYFDRRAEKLGAEYTWTDAEDDDWKYDRNNGVELFLTKEEVR